MFFNAFILLVGSFAIYINDLPKGLLIIKVENELESFTTKIIIEK